MSQLAPSSPAIPTPPIEQPPVVWWKNPWLWLGISIGAAIAFALAFVFASRNSAPAIQTVETPPPAPSPVVHYYDATPDTPTVQKLKEETWKGRKLEADARAFAAWWGATWGVVGGCIGFVTHYIF